MKSESDCSICSKKREVVHDLAPMLWNSFGTTAALLQEIINIYPAINPATLTAHQSNRYFNGEFNYFSLTCLLESTLKTMLFPLFVLFETIESRLKTCGFQLNILMSLFYTFLFFRVCNALALLQCVASHPETRSQFLLAHVPLFLYPFLHTVSKTRPFEYLRLTSLGVIGALVKVFQYPVKCWI